MWTARIKIKHECVIGSRCENFQVTSSGMPFNSYKDKGIFYTPQIQTIFGDEKSVQDFINDIKKDKRVQNLEIEDNTIFFTEARKEKIPSIFYTQKLIFVKPVTVDKEGYEYWEVASWKRSILNEFIVNTQKEFKNFKILKIEQTKLSDIYFRHLMPKLSKHQKRAIELAFENGYYAWPKRTDLGKLSKQLKVSVPTFREHLKRAEEKLMPDLIKSIK